MYNYNSKEKMELIEISSAKKIEGRYEFIEGLYREVDWGKPRLMLYIEFEKPNEEIDAFYVSDHDFTRDFQHTTNQTQKVFFFPIGEDMSLDNIRIYGVKMDKENSQLRLRPVGKMIAKSEPLKDFLSLESKKEHPYFFHAPPFPHRLSAYVRSNKVTGPRIARALEEITSKIGIEAAREVEKQFRAWSKFHNRHFNTKDIQVLMDNLEKPGTTFSHF